MPAYGHSPSSSGDEILIGRGNNPGGSNGRFPTTPKRQQTSTRSVHAGQATPVSASRPSLSFMASVQKEKGESSKDVEAGSTSNAMGPAPKQKKPPVALKTDPYEPAPPEVLEELKHLQGPIIYQAHQNRLKRAEYATISPEVLAQAREGPGTDPSSEICQKIEKARLFSATLSSKQPVFTYNTGFPTSNQPSAQAYLAQWDAYKRTPRVYPRVEGDKILFTSMPAPGQEYKEPPATTTQPREVPIQDPSKHAPEDKWADAFMADWEYRPSMCSDSEAFRDWFRSWLDTTIMNPRVADIFHPSFFDGTAHADGVGAIYIGNFVHEPTIIAQDDEMARLHKHETAEGYAHNIGIRIKKNEEEDVVRAKRAREAYLESLNNMAAIPNPHVPKANIYLRPVEDGDAPELTNLMNWYMEHSSLSTDIATVGQDRVRARIEGARTQRFPFIVAVERRTVRERQRSDTETILGFALANEFTGKISSGCYTARLQVFVRDDSKRKGIGRCLMDKILEVCDVTFHPKGGYYFEKTPETGMGYHPGGDRKLARLIFTITYPDNDRDSYEWILDWLKKYGFEEQGLLKGVAMKFNR